MHVYSVAYRSIYLHSGRLISSEWGPLGMGLGVVFMASLQINHQGVEGNEDIKVSLFWSGDGSGAQSPHVFFRLHCRIGCFRYHSSV